MTGGSGRLDWEDRHERTGDARGCLPLQLGLTRRIVRYLNIPAEATCPVCQATDVVELYSVQSEEAAQHYVLREVHPERHDALRDHIEALWNGDRARILQCTRCGFGFASPYVAGDATFYTLAYERTGYPADKWEFDVTIDTLRGLLPHDGTAARLLEVGAGDGAFLRRVVPALLPATAVIATEYSAFGQTQIEAMGVECRMTDLRSDALDDQRGALDFICLFQVLEHLDGLDAVFERCTELATTDGHVFIAVPNNRAIASNEHTGSLLDLPPNHVGRWTREAFEVISARYGWHLAEHRVEPDRASEKAMQHVQYRYMKRRQRASSVANRVERMPPGAGRTALKAAVAGGIAIATLPALIQAVRTPGLGGSQWVHLTRRSP